MFSARLTITSLVAFVLLAAATNPVTTTVTVTAPASTATAPASQCNTGGLQCCNSVQSSNSAPVSILAALLGVVIQGVSVPVGLTCSPINILGIGSGGACTAQPVCCSNNNFSGIIAIGCTPINVGL